MQMKSKEYVTHEELDVWGGEIMRQLDEVRNTMATKEDIAGIREEMATKEDIAAIRAEMATKEDLKQFATKEDLKGLATKVELERVFLMLDEIRENTKK